MAAGGERGEPRWGRTVVDVAIGITVPVLLTLLLRSTDEPTLFRPGVVLLTATILLAVGVGFRAGLSAAITGCAAVAIWFTDAADDTSTAVRVLSVAVFAAGCCGVLVVVDRLDRARRSERQLGEDRFRGALDSMLDNVAIARAVRDEHGEIVDFVMEHVNTASLDGAGRTAEEMVGRSVLELYPNWRTGGMFEVFAQVVQTGEPFLAERVHYQDRLDDGTPIDGYWNLQVVQLGDGYLAASRDVSQLVRLEQVERDARELADRERAAVELLQQAALPDSLPQLQGVGLDATYRPASSRQPIGGDWYDAFTLPDGRLGAVIADVSGHGPSAAAFMVQVRNVFRAVASLREGPGEVLATVNQVVCGFEASTDFFVTCCYCVIDTDAGELAWASAGHPPPIVVHEGVAALIERPGGIPLAVAADATYPLHRVVLSAGDRVVLYTDGLFERRDEDVDAGLERLRSQVEALGTRPVSGMADHLADSVADPFDDMAALVVELGA